MRCVLACSFLLLCLALSKPAYGQNDFNYLKIGIPKANIKKIHQPFFTTKPIAEGTGLGLSLNYDIVTKGHGGNITVDTQENEFTEFTITTPIQ